MKKGTIKPTGELVTIHRRINRSNRPATAALDSLAVPESIQALAGPSEGLLLEGSRLVVDLEPVSAGIYRL